MRNYKPLNFWENYRRISRNSSLLGLPFCVMRDPRPYTADERRQVEIARRGIIKILKTLEAESGYRVAKVELSLDRYAPRDVFIYLQEPEPTDWNEPLEPESQ